MASRQQEDDCAGAPRTAPALPDDVLKVVKREARELASRYKVSPARVQRILTRIVESCIDEPILGGKIEDGVDYVRRIGEVSFGPSLDEAVRWLGPEDSLRLFEREDLVRLGRLQDATVCLAGLPPVAEATFYTLDELADLLEGIVDDLHANREPLLRTGLPETRSVSGWPAPQLTGLYPIKQCSWTVRPRRDDALASDTSFGWTWPERGVYVYTWENESEVKAPGCASERSRAMRAYHDTVGRGLADGSVRTSRRSTYATGQAPRFLVQVRPCAYEQASPVPWLDPAEAARLELGRANLLDLKIQVLKRLIAAARQLQPVSLWDDCLEILTKLVTAEEAEFYLRMDHLYDGYDFRTGMVDGLGWAADWRKLRGGFTDLLEIFGDVECELTIGAMHRTKQSIAALIDPNSLRSYYQFVKAPYRADFDAALDRYFELEKQEEDFIRQYRDRVNEALENEFYEEVIVRTKVKRKLIARFEPMMTTYAEYRKAELESGVALAEVRLPVPSTAAPTPANVFRREGDYWILAYAGSEVRLKDAAGLRYIAMLLRTPGRERVAADLAAEVNQSTLSRDAGRHGGMSGEQLENQGLRTADLGDAGEVADRQTIDAIKVRWADLQDDLREAEGDGDRERAARLQQEIDALEGYVTAARGLGGRPRKAFDGNERTRKAVSNAIRRSLEHIRREHPELGQHLGSTIHTGRCCSYTPDPRPDWDLGMTRSTMLRPM